jgi:hypothetical protein
MRQAKLSAWKRSKFRVERTSSRRAKPIAIDLLAELQAPLCDPVLATTGTVILIGKI